MEASNLLAGRARAAAPCVCVAVADASSRPAELFGLGQPASRARAFGTSLSVFSTLLAAPMYSRDYSKLCDRGLKKETPLLESRIESTGRQRECQRAPHNRRDRSQKVARTSSNEHRL